MKNLLAYLRYYYKLENIFKVNENALLIKGIWVRKECF